MNYDLTQKEDRKRFIKRANSLLKNQRNNVALIDESLRTPNQNCYLHVLCRILADYTGETEYYAKQIYFKEMANPDIFITTTKDKLSGKMMRIVRSTTALSIPEMSRAIDNFIRWAAESANCELPAATLDDDGKVVFNSDKDKDKFRQAQIKTSRMDDGV